MRTKIIGAGFMGAGLMLAAGALANDNPHVYTAENQTIEQICAKTECRKGGYEVVTWLDEKHYQTVPVSLSPYVTEDGSILVFPGETLAFQFSIIDGKLSAPKFLKRFAAEYPAWTGTDKIAANPEDAALPKLPENWPTENFDALPANTLVVSYGQPEHKAMTLLTLHSSLPENIKVDAIMSIIAKNGYDWSSTTTCPVMAKHSSVEIWYDPMGPMTLSNIHFVSAGETACK
jgi:hypothetical protein